MADTIPHIEIEVKGRGDDADWRCKICDRFCAAMPEKPARDSVMSVRVQLPQQCVAPGMCADRVREMAYVCVADDVVRQRRGFCFEDDKA